MKSVMTHQFSQVPRADIPRSSFDLSHGHKTTFDADVLIPIMVEDVIPGDSWNCQASFFARLATPLHPIMDNMQLSTFFFFTPYRLIWSNWEKFCGAQEDPADSIDFTIPVMTGNYSVETGSPADYMGIPLSVNFNTTTDISALPNRAFRLIWNDWFRDENLQDSKGVALGNGPDAVTTYEFSQASYMPTYKRGKRKDYFTSALPWPQKGGTAVSLPLGTKAMVVTPTTTPNAYSIEVEASGNYFQMDTDATFLHTSATTGSSAQALYADLTNATASTINDIRLAFQTQRLLERDARSGTRYVETLKAHFGVTSPDFRLQRPEFLGGGNSTINVTPVAQTSGQPTPAAEDKLGNLAGYGTVSGTHGFTKSFVEHGVIIGLVNVSGDITYSQGVDRYWTKSTRYDFYYPVLSNLGEQSILNKEIWHNAAGTDNEDVFGYQERYAEYRYGRSKLTGLMRPDASGSLESWHLSEDFATLPTLGSTFILSNLGTPLDRAIAISTEPHFIADFFFNIKAARPMPLYGVPGNLDHF